MNETMNKILDKLLFDGIVMDIAPDYAEPGYTLDTGKEKILIGDWNSSAIDKELTEKLEECFELVWSDEYMVCMHCTNAFRVQPDSYMWQPYYYVFNECEPVCFDCVSEEEDWLVELIEDFIDEPTKLMQVPIDTDKLVEQGFTRYNEYHYESGFHRGQDDRPDTIMESVITKLVVSDYDFIFVQSSAEQFAIRFDLYYRQKPTS